MTHLGKVAEFGLLIPWHPKWNLNDFVDFRESSAFYDSYTYTSMNGWYVYFMSKCPDIK